MRSGERPTGAANGKRSNTMASCQPPPPPKSYGLMGNQVTQCKVRQIWSHVDRMFPLRPPISGWAQASQTL